MTRPALVYPTCKTCGVRVHRNHWAAKQPVCPACGGPLRGGATMEEVRARRSALREMIERRREGKL